MLKHRPTVRTIVCIVSVLALTSCGKNSSDESSSRDVSTEVSEPDDASNGPMCGNGQCDGQETCLTCAADCSCSCGDGVCTFGESCRQCASDCDCETLSATPPMGWNSWNKFDCDISEELAKGIADALVDTGLKELGYEYLNLDDCWQIERDEKGEIVADPERFPSGIPALADYVHGKGLKFGLYTCAGSKTCEERPGSLGYEAQDAATYAKWGVDFIKVDWCFTDGLEAAVQYKIMNDALQAVDRPIVHSICNWGLSSPWVWGASRGQLWRTSADIFDAYISMLINVEATATRAAFASVGHWNDPDMLEVGNGGMTFVEYQSHMSIWSIMASPLILGNDLRDMSAETLSLLTNKDVIDVNQDPAGLQGVRLQREPYMIWSRPIALYGSRAVVLFNHTDEPQTLSVTWEQLGLASGTATVRDLWAQKTLGAFESGYSTPSLIEAHGSVMLIVTGEEHTPPSGDNFLSDMAFKHGANGLGPIERDRSNGREPAGDGQPLTIAGKGYEKGLGTYGAAIIQVHLGGQCTRFVADVGLDDTAEGKGTVVFQVMADGAKLFESGVMTGQDAAQSIDVDLTGKHELTLRVVPGDEKVAYDYANWARAQLNCL